MAAGQVVGIAANPAGDGYWLVGSDGTVYALSGAPTYGSLTNSPPQRGHKPSGEVVGIAVTPDGAGYWLVSADGTVTSFGDGTNFCSSGTCASLSIGPAHGQPPAGQVVGIAANPAGQGYWLVSSGGTVYALSGAPVYGSLVATPPDHGARGDHGDKPSPNGGSVVGIAPTPDGAGYWLASTDGTITSFGDATTYTPAASAPPGGHVVAITALPY